MKRNKSLIPLSQHHHHGLVLSKLIRKDAVEYPHLPNDLQGKISYTLSFWDNELISHFAAEEEILFPFAKGKNSELDLMFKRMFEEHKVIETIVETIRNSGDPDGLLLDRLGLLLESHIRMEERELFVEIEKHFSEEELAALSDKFK